jgi:hypothetical protein
LFSVGVSLINDHKTAISELVNDAEALVRLDAVFPALGS